MELFYHFIFTNTAGLYKVVYSSRFFFIDYWSFIHFISGVFLMVTARAMKFKKIWSILFLVLFVYEVIEVVFLYLSINVFKPETFPDQLTDIIVGLLGAFTATKLTTQADHPRVMKLHWLTEGARLDGITAAVLAYAWVSYYGYHYNIRFLNSFCVNWWAMMLWTIGLYSSIRLLKIFRRSFSIPVSVILTWILILTATFIIEFFGYNILKIHETGGYPPLFLNIIHGTPLLKFMYIVAAPVAIVSSALVNWAVHMLSQLCRRILLDVYVCPENVINIPEVSARCKD